MAGGRVVPERIFYMHVAKTGGTSLNNLLAEHFPAERSIIHIESRPEWHDPRQTQALPDPELITGHVGVHAFARRFAVEDYFKIATFRRPVDHIVSHLSWVRHLADPGQGASLRGHPQPIQDLALRMQDLDLSDPGQLGDFIANMDNTAASLFDNSQTRYLGAVGPGRRVTQETLDRGMDNAARLDLVGITERLDEMVAMLCLVRGWKIPAMHKRLNITSERYGLDPSNEALVAALWPAIRFDQVVYDYARERFVRDYHEVLANLELSVGGGETTVDPARVTAARRLPRR